MQRTTATLVAALFAAALAGCAGSPQKESTGEYVDDTAITTKVKTAFVKDKAVDAMDIKVETFKGTVQLSGYADSSAEASRAVELARTVPGVKAVRNDIQVKSR